MAKNKFILLLAYLNHGSAGRWIAHVKELAWLLNAFVFKERTPCLCKITIYKFVYLKLVGCKNADLA